MTQFCDWNYKHIESRIFEMLDTFRLMPPESGPRQFGNNMPEPVRRYEESYGHQIARYRRVPTAGAISRAMETMTWINAFLTESERFLIYGWGAVKAQKGKKVSDFADNFGKNSRTLRRMIIKVCQQIADRLNQGVHVRETIALAEVSQNLIHEETDTLHDCVDETEIAREKRKPFWQAPGAKPQIDPDAPMVRLLKPRKPKRGRGKKKPRRSGARA